ncbi:MAG: YqgE/AlgH family protein [Akkermansiaceae bacterium]|jgi:putative transcriptional regulator|nr:YqgE/AlgH family protein [Akkermansiaceae bacterium]
MTPELPIDLSGKLLLASPTLRDGIFDHSVIYLAHHSSDDGALGVILNHPTGREVAQFLPQPDFEPLARIPVHVGGPVARDQLTFATFRRGKSGHFDFRLRISAADAIEHAHTPGTVVRAYIGYSGWTAGQLEGELEGQSWITLAPGKELPGLSHDRDLWHRLMSSVSPFHRLMADAPRDAGLN